MAIWGNDLPKVQTAARSVGLRVRFPFLDPQLAAFTGTLPASMKVRGLKKRYLFKRAVADLLPSKILQKPKKGFGVPIAEWIRTNRQVRETILDPVLDPKSFVRECITTTGLQSIVDNHLRGRWNYGGWLWAAMMLERWIRAKRTVQYTCIFLGILEGEMAATAIRA
jgi:asparagine synthase (glutamine-hydrolysing)